MVAEQWGFHPGLLRIGGTGLRRRKGGGGMLEKKGVILAGDLMGTKARLLLLALAEVGNNREDLRRYFK